MSDAIQNLIGRLGVSLDGNGNLTTTGNVTAKGSLAVTGNATVTGNQTVTGNLTVTGNIVGTGQATLSAAPIAVNTVGAATLTAAQLAGKNLTRGGTQTANWTDTTDTAVAIFAQFPNATLGQIFGLQYINNSSFSVTISGGVGVTGSTSIVVPPLSSVDIYFTITSSTAVAMSIRATGNLSNQPPFIYQTTAAGSGVITASLLTGGMMAVLSSSGATALTTPTAAALLAATPNGGLGDSWLIRIINTNAGTLTITADATVTVTGTKTLATNTWREFICTILTATTASWQQIGTGTTS